METFVERERADKARHRQHCAVCRDNLRPDTSQRLYAVKNARTREFVHVLVNGESIESKLGWPREEILYAMLVENGVNRPPMSEEVKARLRRIQTERKAVCGPTFNSTAIPKSATTGPSSLNLVVSHSGSG